VFWSDVVFASPWVAFTLHEAKKIAVYKYVGIFFKRFVQMALQ
jgi:hypothetical protein